MWPLLITIFVALVVVFIFRSGRATDRAEAARRSGSERPNARARVTTADIPALLAALSAAGTDGSFAVLLFGEGGQPPTQTDALNVQFSIEGGRTGIDWVLLAPLNRKTRSRFVTFFESKGRTVEKRESNDVKSLRVEGDQLAELLQEFLRAKFGVPSDQPLALIADGFEWDDEGDEADHS